jgi:hypothetical protein
MAISREDGQQLVDDVRRRSRNSIRLNGHLMDGLFIHGRPAVEAAAELIELYGLDAGSEAAARAHQSRDDGNVERFCHWRQIERLIAALSSDAVLDTVH